MTLPDDFIGLLREAYPQDAGELLASLDAAPPVSVRWNPFKTAAPPDGVAVPWNRYGRYLPERPSFTADPRFHAGAYYVQEASSMFVEHLVRAAADPEGAMILDLCAAPGGKSTLYATLAGPEGLVVANEVVRSRALTLADNARRWGTGNILVTNNDPSHFTALSEWFDIVAVDAPCSGEGMFRKNSGAVAEWSRAGVDMCAARQRRILSDVWEALRPGGVLIYSTCTFNRHENEDNVKWLARTFDCSDPVIDVPREWNIALTEAGGIRCFRLRPDRLAGEGFFAAAIRKEGANGRKARPKTRKTLFTELQRSEKAAVAGWVGQEEFIRAVRVGENIYGYYDARYRETRMLSEYLNALHSGVCFGQLPGGKLRPDHSLALFHDVNRNRIPVAELTREDALRYLRREEPAATEAFAEGFNLVAYDGFVIGWAKRVGGRINNMYPKSQMIVNK